MASEASRSTGWYDVLGWLESNKQLVIWIIGILAVGIFVLSYLLWAKGEKEMDASKALSNVRATQPQSGAPNPAAAAEYLKVAEEHRNTDAAARALLLAAGALFIDGKHAEAQTQFEKFLREQPESPFRVQALLGAAASLDAEGKVAEATTRYRQVIERYPQDPAATQAKSALARLHEAQNNPEEALRLYNELMRVDSLGSVGRAAAIRRAELLRRHPDLARSSAPPVATPVAPIEVPVIGTSTVTPTSPPADAPTDAAAPNANPPQP